MVPQQISGPGRRGSFVGLFDGLFDDQCLQYLLDVGARMLRFGVGDAVGEAVTQFWWTELDLHAAT